MLKKEQVKGKIKNIAKNNKADARILLRMYMMERFLERVAVSSHSDGFIIKGGILVTSMVGVSMRSTMDIDITIRGINLTEEDVLPIIREISQKNDGTYQMVLTIRGAYADIFWFSLFHELGHIVNGDVNGTANYIDYDEHAETEIGANDFASTRLIDPEEYAAFVEKGDYSLDAIKTFARSQSVRPYIVIGRLQREKKLDYNRYSSEKVRYKWA